MYLHSQSYVWGGQKWFHNSSDLVANEDMLQPQQSSDEESDHEIGMSPIISIYNPTATGVVQEGN